MKSITRRVIAAAGALAMAGGVMAATAVPAYADGFGTEAYAVQASGDLGFVPPVALAESPDGFESLYALPLFHFVGLAHTIDEASNYYASSDTTTLGVKQLHDGSPVLWAYHVRSRCWLDDGDAYGTATLQLGRIWYGGVPFFLPTDPDPNTWYHVPGFGAINLNHQHWHNGDLTVTAIRIYAYHERISIGVTRCDGED